MNPNINPQTYMNLKATLYDLMEEKKASDSRIAELEKQVKEKDETIDSVVGKFNTVTNIADNRAERLRDAVKENRDLRRDNATLKADMERMLRKNMLLQDEVRIAKAQGNRKLDMNEVKQMQKDIHEKIVKEMIHQLNHSIAPTAQKSYAPTYNPLESF